MKASKAVASALIILGALAPAGCGGITLNRPNYDGDPGPADSPFHKWFNPEGKLVQDHVPDKCASREVDAVIPPSSDPPAEVPAGYNWATVELVVNGLKLNEDHTLTNTEFCVPVSIHAYITANGQSVPVLAHDGSHGTPWDALRNTPYEVVGIVVWGPDVPPPVISVDFSAKYEHDIDTGRREGQHIGLMCHVRLNREEVVPSRMVSLDVDREQAPLPGTSSGVTGPFVRCQPAPFSVRPF